MESIFTDETGARFDLNSDIYNPKQRTVNDIIRRSVGQQLVAGTFRDIN